MPVDLNVSIEDHLLQSLRAVLPVLPKDIQQSLEKYVREQSPHIPYSVLFHVSQWSRTTEGRAALTANDLDAASYSTVALLAGTLTSPERRFGNYVPPKDPDQVAVERARERKVITALANAVLSVAGVGVGAYWASEKAGWKNEWRALFAFFCSAVVAISEAGLYLIWQWRSADASRTAHRKPTNRHKKVDLAPEVDQDANNLDENKTLRRRRK